MKSMIYGLIALAVMGLAFWAYQQNYTTQAALRETQAVRADMARLRDRLAVLRAEWAYLNRPDRLRDLANLNYDRLKLFPLAPEQFGTAEQVALPPPPVAPVSDLQLLRGDLVEEGQ
ncbi:MAG: cell division protein FtsL [Pseudomonadota bacterium]